MQLSYNQPKSATMSNNASNFTNYFNMQGKVLNNFGHQQSEVSFEFFEDGLAASTKQPHTNADSEACYFTSENNNDDDILTQNSDSSKPETPTIHPNVCQFAKNVQNIPDKGNTGTTDMANHMPAKEVTPNTDTAKLTSNPKEHGDWLTILNNAFTTNQPPQTYGPILNFHTPAKSNPMTSRVSASSSTTIPGLQPQELAPTHTFHVAARDPIRNPNAILDENGQFCNGFVSAHALLTAKKQLHGNAPPSPSKSILHTRASDTDGTPNIESKTGRKLNKTTAPPVLGEPENGIHKQTATTPRNPYTLRKNTTNTDIKQNPPSTIAPDLPAAKRSDKDDEESNRDPKTPSSPPRTTANPELHQITPNNELQRICPNIQQKPKKIYLSPFLDSSLRPSETSFTLTPDLEPLRSLIMSQHEAFSDNIKELGEITLSSTSTIDGKIDSYKQLKYNNKIPRSLRIKCKLTTSPDFSSDEVFRSLKEELDNIVSEFTIRGAKVMTDWTHRNIHLLQHQRCMRLLNKALPILECLTAFHLEVIGNPQWPSTLNNINNTSAFLLKIYFNNLYIDTSDIIQFFELPVNEILLVGLKLLLKTNSNDEASTLLLSLQPSDIITSNEMHYMFITETLIQFDQILRGCSIDLWQHHKEKTKNSTAALKITAKMAALRTANATSATALAINKATDLFNSSQEQDCETKLRLTNLEKNFQRQEQKTNEIANKINRKQKNLNGSRQRESTTSPSQQAPVHQHQQERKTKPQLVDLTMDTEESQGATKRSLLQKNQNQLKKQRKLNGLTSNQEISIQWKEAEIRHFNPDFPAGTSQFPQQQQQPSTEHMPRPRFASALPPTPLTAPSLVIHTNHHASPFLPPMNQQLRTAPNPFCFPPPQTNNNHRNKNSSNLRKFHGVRNKQPPKK